MPKLSKAKITIFIIVLGAAVVLGAKFFGGIVPHGMRPLADARGKGNKNAPIHITEFIDLECSACARGAKYLTQIMVEHPAAIRLEVKYYPLQSHRHGLLAARYTECAARQGKFWSFHDALLERQANWSRLMDAAPAFAIIARDVALDTGRLTACLNDKSVDAVIEQNRLEGSRRGVKSTPTYYVNGKMVVGVQSLEPELERLLAENKR